MAQKKKKVMRKKVSVTRTKKRTLTATEVDFFKELLLEKRRELFGDVDKIENDALRKSRLDASGDLSSMPIHMADLGTDNFEQEFALGLIDSERKLLKEIDDALVRINRGFYGICEGTGKQIAKARLEAKPWARYCVEYAQKLEDGFVVEVPESFESVSEDD